LLPIVVAQITVTGDRAHVPLENAERRRSIAEKMIMPEHEEMWPKSFRTSIDALSTYVFYKNCVSCILYYGTEPLCHYSNFEIPSTGRDLQTRDIISTVGAIDPLKPIAKDFMCGMGHFTD
jgi:hypothetical protein